MNPPIIISGNIEFLEFWHAGSGEAGVGDIDDTPIRDKDGLPYLPGKSLKGLFHEAMCELAAWSACPSSLSPSPQDLDLIFGSESNQGNLHSGILRFESASLPKETAQYIHTYSMQDGLFDTLSATAIEESGIAKAHSLRCFEVAAPVNLSFSILLSLPETSETATPSESAITAWLSAASGLIHKAGKFRNNGLGRCVISLTHSPSPQS